MPSGTVPTDGSSALSRIAGVRATILPGERSFQGPSARIVGEVDRDEVEHNRRDHLVGAGVGLERARDSAPERAHGRAKQQRQRKVDGGWQPGDRKASEAGDQRAKQQLPLRPDVEQAALKGQRDRQAAKYQRRGLLSVRPIARAFPRPPRSSDP